jgi:hypothetical protein
MGFGAFGDPFIVMGFGEAFGGAALADAARVGYPRREAARRAPVALCQAVPMALVRV